MDSNWQRSNKALTNWTSRSGLSKFKMTNKNIAIIGVGHMGQAIATGLMRGKIIDRNNLILSNGEKNIVAAKTSEIIIIAVKPKIVESVAKEIKPYLRKRSIIISAAACVNIDILEKYFGDKTKIVRIMPNLPVAIGKGVVGWLGNKNITGSDERLVISILSSLGYLMKCKDENMLDKLTVISGCGPAYVAYFIENLQNISRKYGLSNDESKKITQEIFSGTLTYLSTAKVESGEFIKSIATKGGITETIIDDLKKNNFQKIIAGSIKKGYVKMIKIQKQLNN